MIKLGSKIEISHEYSSIISEEIGYNNCWHAQSGTTQANEWNG